MNKCVHTEHCCAIHGCKYYDGLCPVKTGEKQQSGPCWDCIDDEINSLDKVIQFVRIMKSSYDVARMVKDYQNLSQEDKLLFLKEIG